MQVPADDQSAAPASPPCLPGTTSPGSCSGCGPPAGSCRATPRAALQAGAGGAAAAGVWLDWVPGTGWRTAAPAVMQSAFCRPPFAAQPAGCGSSTLQLDLLALAPVGRAECQGGGGQHAAPGVCGQAQGHGAAGQKVMHHGPRHVSIACAPPLAWLASLACRLLQQARRPAPPVLSSMTTWLPGFWFSSTAKVKGPAPGPSMAANVAGVTAMGAATVLCSSRLGVLLCGRGGAGEGARRGGERSGGDTAGVVGWDTAALHPAHCRCAPQRRPPVPLCPHLLHAGKAAAGDLPQFARRRRGGQQALQCGGRGVRGGLQYQRHHTRHKRHRLAGASAQPAGAGVGADKGERRSKGGWGWQVPGEQRAPLAPPPPAPGPRAHCCASSALPAALMMSVPGANRSQQSP